jgi:hypothetical protein
LVLYLILDAHAAAQMARTRQNVESFMIQACANFLPHLRWYGPSVWRGVCFEAVTRRWLAADRLMTGSLDEVVKTWCVWGAVRRRRRGGAHVAVGNV